MAKKIILTYEINLDEDDDGLWDWMSLIEKNPDLGMLDNATLTNAVIKRRVA